MARYEAKQNFSNPLIDRRFRLGEVYDLDAAAEGVLAPAIERGRLVRLPDDADLGTRRRPAPSTTEDDADPPEGEGDA